MAWETKVVRIHQNGTVDTDSCQLCKSANPKQRILWVSESDQDYDVRFDPGTGSPFRQNDFAVPAGGSVSSGAIDANAKPTKYPYHTYQAGTMQVAADPDVSINP